MTLCPHYEAVLACLAIIVWHFYHVIFDPDVYPLNLACWDGKVSEHWQQEEHPLERGNDQSCRERPKAASTVTASQSSTTKVETKSSQAPADKVH